MVKMWSRSIIKLNAKTALRGRYWTAFLVSLLALIITSAFSGVEQWNTYSNFIFNSGRLMRASGGMGGFSLFVTLFGIFVGAPILIGKARFYVHNRFGSTDTGVLFSGFSRDYLNGVGAMFVTYLFVGLWYILLIIPGIVKTVQYSMVQYILSDNSAMPGSRARQISRMLTDGEKGAIFVFWLSFLGWYILGLICFGIGFLFVNPYFDASMAELYVFLRDRAIQSGHLNPAELGLQPAAPAPGPVVY
jgi:hypothetical protein